MRPQIASTFFRKIISAAASASAFSLRASSRSFGGKTVHWTVFWSASLLNALLVVLRLARDPRRGGPFPVIRPRAGFAPDGKRAENHADSAESRHEAVGAAFAAQRHNELVELGQNHIDEIRKLVAQRLEPALAPIQAEFKKGVQSLQHAGLLKPFGTPVAACFLDFQNCQCNRHQPTSLQSSKR